jgi:hypothetical protein
MQKSGSQRGNSTSNSGNEDKRGETDARNQGHKGEIQPLKAETRAREGEQTLLKTEM